MDEEKIIIGGWLLGYHLDDMDKLELSDFVGFGMIVKAIKELGTDMFRVSRSCNVPITDLVEMTSMYQPYLYGSAVRQMIETKVKTYLAKVPGDTSITEIAEKLTEFAEAENINNVPKPAEGTAQNYLEELDRRAAHKPVSWGMGSIDYHMGGVRTKELTTVGARPSVGKSAFLLQVGLAIARQKKRVLYFPLEMSEIQTTERMILRNYPIAQKNLRSGTLTKEEWAVLNEAGQKVQNLEKTKNFMIFEGENNLSAIKRLVKIHKPYAVIIDQLTQLTDNKRFKDKREQFSYMTNELKRLSMAEDTAVILAAQINRSAQETEPTMANLKESGSIEEDSDNVILLHRVPLDQIEPPHEFDDIIRPVLIKIEKQRSGGNGVIQSRFTADRFTFEEA